ncbi:MAG: spore maturation protein [Ruminococcaceae bacterium]|nr:spore maturation protein [Oscillospiraceae bacterium]
MTVLIEKVAALSVPLVIGITALVLLFCRKVSFDTFRSGAKEGLACAVSLLPSLIAIIVGVKMLTASGVLDYISKMIEPLTSLLGIPSELLTLLITRPFSGSASMAAYSELMSTYGADSLASFCAAVIMGSSDTIVYIIGIYFSSVGVKRSRYAFPAAFTVMLFCIFFACFLSRIFWRG